MQDVHGNVLPEVCTAAIVNERALQLLRQLMMGGFSEIAGTDASITLPVSKRLLNDLISTALPPSARVRDLDVSPLDGDRFLVRGRIGSSPFLPPLKLKVAIDRQPEFPDSPILALRVESTALMLLANPMLRMMSLPAWIRIEQDRVHVDLLAFAAQYRLSQYAGYVESLRVNTVAGRVTLSVQARIK